MPDALPRSAELTGYVLERNGCPIHYWLGEPTDRPLVVFTHGAMMDHHGFDPQVPEIAREYRVMTWDVRGHGKSHPMGMSFTVQDCVEDLVAILDAIGANRAVFIGHSNGTYIGQEMVFLHPERVRALVVIDGTCITCRHSLIEHLALGTSTFWLRLFPWDIFRREVAKACAFRQDVRDSIYETIGQISKEDFLTIWYGVTHCLHYEPGYRIPCPMLLVHGDHDTTGDIRKIAPVWAAREPDCRYVVIPDARHNANQDNPNFFNRVLVEFLRENVA